MKKFILAYEEWLFAVIGFLLFALIAGFTFWTISSISAAMGSALTAPNSAAVGVDFKLNELQGLTLRGLNFGQ